MTKVLAIDTSTYVLGVGIIEEDKVVGELVTHLKKIIPFVRCQPSNS